jgi:hypothetical protein
VQKKGKAIEDSSDEEDDETANRMNKERIFEKESKSKHGQAL